MLDVTGLFSRATAGLAERYVGGCWAPPTLGCSPGSRGHIRVCPVARRDQGLETGFGGKG